MISHSKEYINKLRKKIWKSRKEKELENLIRFERKMDLVYPGYHANMRIERNLRYLGCDYTHSIVPDFSDEYVPDGNGNLVKLSDYVESKK